MLAPGATVPDFTLADAGGRSLRLSDSLAGGPVLLFVFKVDCATSALAAPVLERLRRSFAAHQAPEGTGLGVIAISQDSPEATAAFQVRYGPEPPALLDLDLAVSRSLDIEMTPTLLHLRGADRLRSAPGGWGEESRLVEAIEGWSKQAYVELAETLAARLAALPADLELGELPPFRPG